QVIILVKSVTWSIRLDKLLVSHFINLHSGLSWEERIKRYTIFKAFEKRMLVATDIFGRETDTDRANIIVNYNRPPDLDSCLNLVGYVHFQTDSDEILIIASLVMRVALALSILPRTWSRYCCRTSSLPEPPLLHFLPPARRPQRQYDAPLVRAVGLTAAQLPRGQRLFDSFPPFFTYYFSFSSLVSDFDNEVGG
ncbi:hypothetical protein P691DRAFT_681667, partial [Macrolepiota fuliginosa MF-IS2]